MVIGKERSNWYEDHPAACTCAQCEARKASDRQFRLIAGDRKIGRNELCPCGSNLKFKRCHGT